MAALGLQEFVDALRPCTTADEIFTVFQRDIEAEGFQNISFGRMNDGDFFEVLYFHDPEGTPRDYFNENFAESDPVVQMPTHSASPFSCSESNTHFGQARSAQTVIEVCRDLDLYGDISIPFHGPNGRCDIFCLGLREKRTIGPAHMAVITMKAYATWLRFNDIKAAAQLAAIVTRPAPSAGTVPDGCAECRHHDGPAKITHDECRALVIADTSYRRYRSGFTELNDMIIDIVGPDNFNQLQYRGLLIDEPDDERMRFVARPSPIATAHLKTCPAVPEIREQVWLLYVNNNERPDL